MISEFFISCSGADKQILNACPTERAKFVGIGATVFLTAVLASISGGYAIYFTFNNLLVSFFFGIFWGLIIFNLDRYIVSSIKKSGKSFREFLIAFPRLLIAIVLAITISKPLEIKLFEGSITKKMGEKEHDYNKKGEVDFNQRRATLDSAKSILQSELSDKKISIYRQDPIYEDYRQQQIRGQQMNTDHANLIKTNSSVIDKNSWLEEIITTGGIIKKIKKYNQLGKDKIAENKRLSAEIASNQLLLKTIADSMQNRQEELAVQVKAMEKQYSAQINGVQQQIDDFNTKRPEFIAKIKADAAADKDILSRLTALSELKESNKSVRRANFLITLLFILLECAPVIVKLIAKRGPYDEILDRVEYEVFLSQQQIISDRNDEVNNALQTTRDANKLKRDAQEKLEKIKLEKEFLTNETLLTDIANGQVNLGKVINGMRRSLLK